MLAQTGVTLDVIVVGNAWTPTGLPRGVRSLALPENVGDGGLVLDPHAPVADWAAALRRLYHDGEGWGEAARRKDAVAHWDDRHRTRCHRRSG